MISNNENENQRDRADGKGATKSYGFLRLLLLAVLLGGVVLFFLAGADEYLTFRALQEHRVMLLDWVTAHMVLAALIYSLAYALVVAFSLPGGLLMTVVGGFLFGRYLATFLVVISATVGAVLVFLAARTILGDLLRAKISGKLHMLEAGFQRNSFSYLLVLRLVPLFPFFLVNLVPAFLGVRLRTYAAATIIGITPASFVFAQFGTGLGSILESSEGFDLSAALTNDVVFSLIGLALLAMVPIVYKRFFSDKKIT
jgi:uncharacterized membrane protein YdjX (TVP38/TMEM64 family)